MGKTLKLILLLSSAVLAFIPILGCSTKSSDTTATTTQVTFQVQRGNLSSDITSLGNLSYSENTGLSFDTGGTVAELLVEAGDTVTEGQVLARLDTSEWQDKITDLENTLMVKQQALTSANETVATKERDVVLKERAVDAAKYQVTLKERAVTAAEQSVADAQYSLSLKERAVIQVQINIDSAKLGVEQAQETFEANTGGEWADENLSLKKRQYELTLLSLDDANRDVDTAKTAIANAQLAVEDAKVALKNAQLAVDDAEQDVADAEQAVNDMQVNVTIAEKAVSDAQKSLDGAKETSPELISPISGLVTAVNVEAGVEVANGTIICTIVDPAQFKAQVYVDETDILNIKINGTAFVELDAISGVSFPATITNISPTATISSGVVNYEVDVKLGNLTETASQTGQAVPVANSVQMNQLKPGLTATVTIVLQEATDVLYVPTQAVSKQGTQQVVNVIADGVISSRVVNTGFSTSQYTEITDGLSAGDQVVYTRTSSSSSSSSNSNANSQQNNLMIPGMGEPPAGGPQGG